MSRSRMPLKTKVRGVAAAMAAALAMTFAVPSTAAYAISNPDPFTCTFNSIYGNGEYFQFWTANFETGQRSPFCYQDRGTAWNIQLQPVYGFKAGNNEGFFTYCHGFPNQNDCFFQPFKKWESHPEGIYTKVTTLTIY